MQVRVVELVNSKEERDRLFAEIRVLKQLKHKNIMSFHDSWLDQKSMCVNFITELFTSGTLRQCVLLTLNPKTLHAYSSLPIACWRIEVWHCVASLTECVPVMYLGVPS